MSQFFKQRTLAGLLGAATFTVALGFGAPVFAAAQSAAPAATQNHKKVVQMEQRFMQLRSELARTQEEAVKKTPSLIKEETHFRDLLVSTMKRQGTDPKPKVAELKKLSQQIRDKHTSKSERDKLIARARAIQVDLLKAETKAIKDPHVMAARKKLGTDTIAAMSKVNPKTKEMIAELNAIGHKLAAMNSTHGS